jgi:4'-phosphopantetheinyl transferase
VRRIDPQADSQHTSRVLEIVLARLDVQSAALPPLAMLLSTDERVRAARFRLARDRRRFIVARATLRRLLAARLSSRPESIELAYGPHGKPRLRAGELRFNVSHSEDLALYAFSRRREVGVDIEAVREVPEADRIAPDWFSPADYRRFGFLGCWTRREALAKGLGRGVGDPGLDPSGWSVHGFSPAPGYVAAVAARLH